MGFRRTGMIICDYCKYQVSDQWENLTDARKTMKHYGWSIVKKDGERDDICPNCRLKNNDPKPPICKKKDLSNGKCYFGVPFGSKEKMLILWDSETQVFTEVDPPFKDKYKIWAPIITCYEAFECVYHRTESW